MSLSPECQSVFMFLLGFPFRACMYQFPSWAGTQSSFICRILHTMWGSVEAGTISGREESAEVKNHGKIGTRVCVSGQNTDILSFLCLFMSRLSVQFLFCSFIWDWRGGFSLSKAVLFTGELWYACSGSLKLSEQSLLVSAPCPGGRPYPGYPLLAHCWPGSSLVCWRVVQSHLRERRTCETWFCALG